MRIWIINSWETLPIDKNQRIMRMGILASFLADRGHDVTWWSSSFIHGDKKHRVNGDTKIQVNDNETLLLMHSKVTYKKNVSIKRIIYHKILAGKFSRLCKDMEVPDIIICSYPTVQLVIAAEKYAKKHGVPVMVDVRDMWPDTFIYVIPESLRKIGKYALIPLIRQSKRAFTEADSITSVVPSILEWATKRAERYTKYLDRVIHISYEKTYRLAGNTLEKELLRWSELGVTEETWNICFVGTLGVSLDMKTCIEGVKDLVKEFSNIRFVVCGDGDKREDFMEEAKDVPEIVFPGWCNNNQIRSLFAIGSVGLYPYKNRIDYKNAFGNKIIQYMAEGLPVLSSLEGYSKSYIEQYKIGINYEEGNSESFQNAISKLISLEQERSTLSQNALDRFAIDFSPEIINSKFEQLIEEIVNDK